MKSPYETSWLERLRLPFSFQIFAFQRQLAVYLLIGAAALLGSLAAWLYNGSSQSKTPHAEFSEISKAIEKGQYQTALERSESLCLRSSQFDALHTANLIRMTLLCQKIGDQAKEKAFRAELEGKKLSSLESDEPLVHQWLSK
jgi:hypothetical protein